MDQFSRLRNELCDNLKLLSIKEFISKRKETFDLKPDSFKKLSQNCLQTITYFLFETLDSEECKKRFKACFPVLDRKQESEFRQITHKWLQEIAEKEKECNFPRIVAFYFQNPCGEAFCHLYLEFSNYVLIKEINRRINCESIECYLIDSNYSDHQFIKNQTNVHFNEYQKTKVEIEKETQKWFNEIQYFIETKHKLLESIKTWEQNKLQVWKKIQLKFGPKIDSNEEIFVQYLKESENEVQVLKNSFILSNDNVNKNWKFYLNSFESKTNSSVNSIDLNNSFDCFVENFVSRLETYDTIIEKAQNTGNDFVSFIKISSKLVNEAQVYKNQLIAITSKLILMSNQLKNSVHKKRSELMKNGEIIERRKWFEQRIIDLTQINFKFEPKKNESNIKDLVTSVADYNSKSPEVCNDFGIFELHSVSQSVSHQLNYSFKMLDISSCEYIPPSGSIEDSRIFSPLESNKQFNH